MIIVAICDDSDKDRKHLQECISGYMQQEKADMILHTYASGEEMEEALQSIRFDLVFLDIYMHALSGIDLAKKVREASESTLIVFSTSSRDHAIDAYSFRAFQYLLKPLNPVAVNRVLKESIEHMQQHKTVEYLLPTDDGMRKVYLDDIYYIESSVRKTIIHFEDATCICPYNINTLESKLRPYGFVRSHRSFVVNLCKVTSVHQGEIALKNGECVFLSKYKQKEIGRAHA